MAGGKIRTCAELTEAKHMLELMYLPNNKLYRKQRGAADLQASYYHLLWHLSIPIANETHENPGPLWAAMKDYSQHFPPTSLLLGCFW